MYRRNESRQLEFVDFYLPFSGELHPENRWVKLAQLVPWELAEQIYAETFCDDFGAPGFSARMALGALLIKEREGLTDRGTVAAIQENPYMQFFVGLQEFTDEPAFDASLMVDFRKRFGEAGLSRISEAIALTQMTATPDRQANRPSDEDTSRDDTSGSNSSTGNASTPDSNVDPVEEKATGTNSDNTNHGKLILDATCAPADIRYPTDVSLLNESREKTEEIIDVLHYPLVGKTRRPRTYRQTAGRAFNAFIRKKKPGRRAIRKAVRKQLGYLRRNLTYIKQLLQNPAAGSLSGLSRRLYKLLLVCQEVYRQQEQMYDAKTNRVDDRIVNLSQPHVRPIKRGKAGRDTEFGAKLSVSVVDGFSFLDHLRWDSFNESCDFVEQVETYRKRLGCYPESVHVDQIYRTRANRAFCKEKGIRISGPPLGRPPKEVSSATKKKARADEVVRNRVEGKFGQAKRRFGLGRIMAKLPTTSAAQISLTFLVMNLEAALVRLFLAFILLLTRHQQPSRRRNPQFQN